MVSFDQVADALRELQPKGPPVSSHKAAAEIGPGGFGPGSAHRSTADAKT
jgi:hypothetical protein